MNQLTDTEAASALQRELEDLSPSVVWSDLDDSTFCFKINVPKGYPGLSTFAKSILARSLHLADQANDWGKSREASSVARYVNSQNRGDMERRRGEEEKRRSAKYQELRDRSPGPSWRNES